MTSRRAGRDLHALPRAAELTVAKGFDWFEMADRQTRNTGQTYIDTYGPWAYWLPDLELPSPRRLDLRARVLGRSLGSRGDGRHDRQVQRLGRGGGRARAEACGRSARVRRPAGDGQSRRQDRPPRPDAAARLNRCSAAKGRARATGPWAVRKRWVRARSAWVMRQESNCWA